MKIAESYGILHLISKFKIKLSKSNTELSTFWKFPTTKHSILSFIYDLQSTSIKDSFIYTYTTTYYLQQLKINIFKKYIMSK